MQTLRICPRRCVPSLQTAPFWRCALSVEAIYLHIMHDSRHKRLKMGFLRACAPSRFSSFFLLNPLVCLKKPYISGIFSFEIRHVRYMPIDVGTAHNHTAAVGKPSILIALISDIPNPAPPPAILMSDVRNVSSRCAYCCHLRRNRTGISCRMPCYSHAPNIQDVVSFSIFRQTHLFSCAIHSNFIGTISAIEENRQDPVAKENGGAYGLHMLCF